MKLGWLEVEVEDGPDVHPRLRRRLTLLVPSTSALSYGCPTASTGYHWLPLRYASFCPYTKFKFCCIHYVILLLAFNAGRLSDGGQFLCPSDAVLLTDGPISHPVGTILDCVHPAGHGSLHQFISHRRISGAMASRDAHVPYAFRGDDCHVTGRECPLGFADQGHSRRRSI